MDGTRHRELQPTRVRPSVAVGPPGRSAVFLDRDGVLNDVVGDGRRATSPRHVSDLHLAATAALGTRRLADEGHVLVVVTNQPDVARGRMTAETALALTRRVVDELALDDGYICPHDGPDGCACRKPAAGLLTQAAHDWHLDLARSWLVGDRWVDIAAAQGAGVRSILVEREYSWDPSGGASPPSGVVPTVVVDDLVSAVDAIVNARPQ